MQVQAEKQLGYEKASERKSGTRVSEVNCILSHLVTVKIRNLLDLYRLHHKPNVLFFTYVNFEYVD